MTLVTGESVGAPEAKRLGLVNTVCRRSVCTRSGFRSLLSGILDRPQPVDHPDEEFHFFFQAIDRLEIDREGRRLFSIMRVVFRVASLRNSAPIMRAMRR